MRLQGLIAVSLVALGMATPLWSGARAEVDGSRQAELMHMLRHDCGSCHGMTLKGGLGPSLLPEALHGKPVEFLEYTILNGRHGSAMPPWNGIVDAEEARWIVQQLLNGEVAK